MRLPPFYRTLLLALNGTPPSMRRTVTVDTVGRQADRDGYFRWAWQEFITRNPTDPLGLLVSPLLDWERRGTPLPKPDSKFLWKW